MTPLLIKYLPSIHLFLGFLFTGLTLAFLMRIVLTWYPSIDIKKGVWLIVTIPTEPILSITRKIVAPIGGVDISPVIWVGLISLFRELLVGQQGILSLILITSENIN